MPNTVVPGFEEILGPALQGLVKSVGEVFRPNAMFQKHMQEKLATDPDMVVKLAALEAKSPGTLAKMGFSDKQMSAIGPQESATAEVERTKRPEIVAAGAQHVEAAATSDKLTADQNKAVIDAMAANPALTRDAAIASLKAPGTKQALSEQAIQSNAYQLDLDKRRASLIVQLPDMSKVDMVRQFRKFQRGELPADVVNSYQADPTTAKTWSDAAQVVHDQDALNEHKLALKSSKKDTAADRVEAKQSQNAYLQWSKSGQAGSIDAWQSYMYDPKVQQRADDLMSGKVKPDGVADEDLIEVATAHGKTGAARFNRDVITASHEVKTTLDKINEGVPDEQRGTLIEQLNTQLETRSKLTGDRKIKAVWNKGRFWGGDVGFVDEKGKPVSSDDVEKSLADPTAGALTPQQQGAYDRIMALPEDQRAAAIMEFRRQDKVGTNASRVSDEIDRRSKK